MWAHPPHFRLLQLPSCWAVTGGGRHLHTLSPLYQHRREMSARQASAPRLPPSRRPRPVLRGKAWNSVFDRKGRHEKLAIIRQPWHFPMAAQNLAAIQIQKCARASSCRASLTVIVLSVCFQAARRAQSHRSVSQTFETPSSSERVSQLEKYLARLQSAPESAQPSGADGYQTWCSSRIQVCRASLAPAIAAHRSPPSPPQLHCLRPRPCHLPCDVLALSRRGGACCVRDSATNGNGSPCTTLPRCRFSTPGVISVSTSSFI
jgi:hypothetical protein